MFICARERVNGGNGKYDVVDVDSFVAGTAEESCPELKISNGFL